MEVEWRLHEVACHMTMKIDHVIACWTQGMTKPFKVVSSLREFALPPSNLQIANSVCSTNLGACTNTYLDHS
jgi:hypothetical protein